MARCLLKCSTRSSGAAATVAGVGRCAMFPGNTRDTDTERERRRGKLRKATRKFAQLRQEEENIKYVNYDCDHYDRSIAEQTFAFPSTNA